MVGVDLISAGKVDVPMIENGMFLCTLFIPSFESTTGCMILRKNRSWSTSNMFGELDSPSIRTGRERPLVAVRADLERLPNRDCIKHDIMLFSSAWESNYGVWDLYIAYRTTLLSRDRRSPGYAEARPDRRSMQDVQKHPCLHESPL